MEHVNEIEIDEEHITINYNEKTMHRYNANEDLAPRVDVQVQ